MDPNLPRMFVEHYYSVFDAGDRSALASLYNNESMLSFEGANIQGQQAIIAKLVELPFKQVKHSIQTLDAQPVANGVLVFTTGSLMVDQNEHPLNFSQVFQLHAAGPNQFIVINDIFRLNYG